VHKKALSPTSRSDTSEDYTCRPAMLYVAKVAFDDLHTTASNLPLPSYCQSLWKENWSSVVTVGQVFCVYYNKGLDAYGKHLSDE
jgi:hypothetical protein